jgi:PleD family two-component response regulator
MSIATSKVYARSAEPLPADDAINCGAIACRMRSVAQSDLTLGRSSQGKCLMDRNQLKTVLYVDDDPDISEIVEMALGLIGDLAVSTCASGEQALKVIPTLKPGLVLPDVMMPAMDGPAALGRMRVDPTLATIRRIRAVALARAI